MFCFNSHKGCNKLLQVVYKWEESLYGSQNSKWSKTCQRLEHVGQYGHEINFTVKIKTEHQVSTSISFLLMQTATVAN